MPTPLDEARRQLQEQVLAARTLPEITAARQALREWLVDHPEEEGMRWGFEQLAQMQEISEIEESERKSVPHKAPLT